MKEIWKEDTTNKWEEPSEKEKEEETQNKENKRHQTTEKKEGEVELILCMVCIVHENHFWDCGRSCKSSKKWKGKSSRGTEEQQKEEHCDMKGTKAKGVEEEDDEHEKEERKDEGKGTDKKWKGGRKRGRSGRKPFYRHCINIVQLESDMNHDMKEFFLVTAGVPHQPRKWTGKKNRTGACGSATFCIHDLVSKTSKYSIIMKNHTWINLWNFSPD